MTFQPSRRTGLNRTVLLSPGQPWHGMRAGRALGAASPLDDDQWLGALECLLRTLVAPTPAERVARPDWDGTDWARWAGTRLFVLCGGVLAAERGELVRERLARKDLRGLPRVTVDPDPAAAGLRGLSAWPPVQEPTLVLDLGHSAVKAAVCTAAGGLGPVTRVSVPWTPFEVLTWPDPSTLLALVRQAAARTGASPFPGAGAASPSRPPAQARVAIANYVQDGQLDPDDTYGTLHEPGGSVAGLLSRALDVPVTQVVNDGQAAALTRAGQRHTAMISIGTSLGVGFPPVATERPGRTRLG